MTRGLLSLSGFTQSFTHDGAGAAGKVQQRSYMGLGWGWREERGPGWETGDSAADQLWDPVTFFLSLGLHRKELTDGVHHLWLNQSESPSTGME